MNDIADSLAREGSASLGPHSQIPIPDSHIKSIIDKETLRRWNAGWLHVEGHRQTKLFFPTINKSKTDRLYKTSKAIYSQAVRWITGFNGLAYQNHKINPVEFPSPLCQLCEGWVEETSSHLISECPALFWERKDAFKTIHNIENLEDIKMADLISFLKNRKVQMMENIAEYPLLFVEDYDHIQHDVITSTNHGTSFDSRNHDDGEDAEEPLPDGEHDWHEDHPPPAKRRDRRPSERTGVG